VGIFSRNKNAKGSNSRSSLSPTNHETPTKVRNEQIVSIQEMWKALKESEATEDLASETLLGAAYAEMASRGWIELNESGKEIVNIAEAALREAYEEVFDGDEDEDE
jgi:hypothetical protein